MVSCAPDWLLGPRRCWWESWDVLPPATTVTAGRQRVLPVVNAATSCHSEALCVRSIRRVDDLRVSLPKKSNPLDLVTENRCGFTSPSFLCHVQNRPFQPDSGHHQYPFPPAIQPSSSPSSTLTEAAPFVAGVRTESTVHDSRKFCWSISSLQMSEITKSACKVLSLNC
jgi:hypothetical protein